MILNSLQDLEPVLQEIETAIPIAVDTETVSLEDLTLVGFSFAYKKDKLKRFYVPVNHKYIDNLDEKGVKKLLTAITNHPSVIYHNYSFDARVLFLAGFEHKHIPHDSMVIAHILNSNQTKSLKKLIKKYFNYSMLTYKEVCGTGKKQISFDKLKDKKIIEKYASEDAEYTYKLFILLYHKLQQFPTLLRLYNTLEQPLLEVVASMHKEGVDVDLKKVKKIKKICEKKRDSYFSKLQYFMGGINLNSSKQLRQYFIHKKGMPVIKRSRKTNDPSVDAEVLKIYAQDSNEAKWILKYRYYNKILNTFIPYFTPTNLQGSTNSTNCRDKIFPSFNQSATTSGRFSSSNPNFQNIPHEDKLGIRQIVTAPEGYKLIGADYCQMELRLAAHFSGDETMIEAYLKGKDIHDITRKAVGCKRRQAKVINFGILYGIGAKSLAKNLDSTYEEAVEYINKFYKKYPKLRQFILESRRLAYDQGHLETFMGRRRYIKENFESLSEYARGSELRSMVNSVIQGSGADIIKAAMVLIYEELKEYDAKIIAQIHDELIIKCKSEQVEKVRQIVERCMKSAGVGLKVSMEVDIEVGDDWEAIH